jgi:hypothetical protein
MATDDEVEEVNTAHEAKKDAEADEDAAVDAASHNS